MVIAKGPTDADELAALAQLVMFVPWRTPVVDDLTFGKATWTEALAEACRTSHKVSASMPTAGYEAARKCRYQQNPMVRVVELEWRPVVRDADPDLWARTL